MRILSQRSNSHPANILTNRLNGSLEGFFYSILGGIQTLAYKKYSFPKPLMGEIISASLRDINRYGLRYNNINFQELEKTQGSSKVSFAKKAVDQLKNNETYSLFVQEISQAIPNPLLLVRAAHDLGRSPDSSQTKYKKLDTVLKTHVHVSPGVLESDIFSHLDAVHISDQPAIGDSVRSSIVSANVNFLYLEHPELCSVLAVIAPHLKKDSLVISAASGYPLLAIQKALKRSDLDVLRLANTPSLNTLALVPSSISKRNEEILAELFGDKRVLFLGKETHVDIVEVCVNAFQALFYEVANSVAAVIAKDSAISKQITTKIFLHFFELMGQALLANKTYEDLEKFESSMTHTQLVASIVKEFERGILSSLENSERRMPGAACDFFPGKMDKPARVGVKYPYVTQGILDHPGNPGLR